MPKKVFIDNCPSCGGLAAIQQVNNGGTEVTCLNFRECGLTTRSFYLILEEGPVLRTEKQALKIWNRREPMKELQEKLDATEINLSKLKDEWNLLIAKLRGFKDELTSLDDFQGFEEEPYIIGLLDDIITEMEHG